MAAPLRGTSFEKSTKEGFHRFLEFDSFFDHFVPIHSRRKPQLLPNQYDLSCRDEHRAILSRVLQIMLGQLLFAIKLQGIPPQPNPELSLKLDERKAQCVAVRKFSRFARVDSINQEMEALAASLDNDSSSGIVKDN
ncbi:uncharacterized protein LOC104417018 [Eucalyptus grandis]|uniref:uncharacterized protein LOC104417018 n=1 Tax=Eucalyptus grandis TaxID=71139 RepID=UPI00192F10D4|nr:uncharacterized protein LOC104417018 [Eucalyptus grandis]